MAFEEKTPLISQQQQQQPEQQQPQVQQQQVQQPQSLQHPQLVIPQAIQQPYQQQQFYYPQYVQPTIIYQNGEQYVAQAPPPGYVYQTVPAYQPPPIVVEKKRCESHNQTNKDTTGAVIIFILGFFISCIWLAGCMYFRSPNKLARGLGILSVVFFCVGVIVAIIVLSVALASSQPYQNFSSSSSFFY
ncbi:hypothetical protein DICPUDRAFT_93629 [Dictyostelium purpureum]|uniref:Uncharacterized protein n=1 Tax=Dictyostelium purpureum TaxID=5786 RepID=F0Z9W7_DICPU|nr:uncharacterized protein DICPUDRAFT_93629 [Dictyostelium purpureum]EGC39287.1 hypothetical protein DICPUDRAFT_93629 [Dictyostelium purpureum]|eukprot:XP_003284191.1 hypothetical protein DICPUDRAFT_93629 [Dictyostelium purpureum]